MKSSMITQAFRGCKVSHIFLLLGIAGLIPLTGLAQSSDNATKYNHNELFGPNTWPISPDGTRAVNGAPTSKYWQNRADYELHATLSERDTTITGTSIITYTNNSPEKLEYLWLQMDQNVFKPNSKGFFSTPASGDRFDVQGFTKGGYHIQSISISYKGKTYEAKPIMNDAVMQVRLQQPLEGKGDQLKIKVNYSFAIPMYGADRMGRMKTKNGYVYEIAQWYPRMCVYDDVTGWNTLPYVGLGEFYCEYGDFDYYITAPDGMLVQGSGDLQNPGDVLTKVQMERLKEARSSDKTVMIIKPEEIVKDNLGSKTKTWHFKMSNSRDVAWSASAAFIWDAARVNLPSGRKAIAMSAYPVESAGIDSWGRSTEYLKNSMEFYSKTYFEYPWNSAVSVSGVALGMEYPGIVFCKSDLKKGALWGDVTHEIGHNWFPMIVGSNERKFMWQDEGLNTFINQFASESFNNGEYKDPADTYSAGVLPMLVHPSDPLMTPPEAMDLNGYGAYYVKTSWALNILRKDILGPERFDFAFNLYIKRWAFKHPQPYDFFRTMNDAAGEDLDWFWKEWFLTDYKLDQAVTAVRYVKNNPANGAMITLENKQQMALPAVVQVVQSNGKSEVIHLPVDVWKRGAKWEFKYNSTTPIRSVTLDPLKEYPDVDYKNNTLLVK
jgi:hypothetical protein